MRFSAQTIAELRSTVTEIEADIRAKRREIENLNEDHRAAQMFLRRAEANGNTAPATPTSAVAPRRNGHAPTGLRDAIRSVVRKAPNGLRPSEITSHLRANGFNEEGSGTDLATRVSSDCSKLKRKGDFTRTARGRYRMAKP